MYIGFWHGKFVRSFILFCMFNKHDPLDELLSLKYQKIIYKVPEVKSLMMKKHFSM